MLVTLQQPLYFSRGFREGGESCDDEIIVFMTETREKYLCPFILMPNIINARNSCDCHCLKKLYVDKSLWRNILKLTIPCDWFYLCRHLLMTMYICVSTYLWHWTALFLCGLVSWRPPHSSGFLEVIYFAAKASILSPLSPSLSLTLLSIFFIC